MDNDNMAWNIHRPVSFKGAISPPGDKSVSHRAIMLAALANGSTQISGWLPAEDCLRTASILRRLGVDIAGIGDDPTQVKVEGKGLGSLVPPADGLPLDCGNSGTTMRLMLGILAAHPFVSILSGDESLNRRPMARVVEPLRKMGAEITGPDDAGHAPLELKGGSLTAGTFELPVASAQVKSALLLAGLHASGLTRLKEPSASRDHTEKLLARLGAKYWKDAEGWHCLEGGHGFQALGVHRIPGDISAAAFFLIAAAITARSDVDIEGVGTNVTRAGMLEVLKRMGVHITIANERDLDGEPVADIHVKGTGNLKGIKISGEIIPRLIDEIPVLAVAACFAEGITLIRDATELRKKESDRIAILASELSKLGAKVGVLPDGLVIEGGFPLKGCRVESHGDHRIAMAMAVAGIGAQGTTQIGDVSCVQTSYPGFIRDLADLSGEPQGSPA